ncbi:hypothetical protein Phum_PHUM165140 [Pediculus humanus corporis]|uniref:Uncharacterized protein n=1 Tax=Pediculus humanus subsp. corporis TaxID=121224 RepID=E0VFR6_PEDHC|nr:uncharacterized protein Phum_PHUM165140 [Pediculus humanus corporis]EEB12222.1 hypothetical protein Phum_PHUM165140 [Pediculus humanus corporis]
MDLELFSRMLSSSESLENIVTSKLNRTKSCQGLGGTDRKRRGQLWTPKKKKVATPHTLHRRQASSQGLPVYEVIEIF